jgi:outer membrane protein OmpU
MKHVLLATTAVVMTASVALADVSLSGKGAAGFYSDAAGSEVWSGIDIDFGGSVTTDGGLTLGVSGDIGAGKIADYADKELDAQGADISVPTVTVGLGGSTVSLKSQGVDDRYDDSQNGDIGLSTSVAGLSVGITYDTDTKVHGGDGANAAIMNATASYSLGYTTAGVTLGLVGTDSNDAGKSAYKISASVPMGDMTFSLKSDNADGSDAVTTGTVGYSMGDVSVSVSADDANDWNASVSYSAGNMTVSYATDENSAWEADASFSMGNGVTMNASSDSNETVVVGVGFSF